MDNNNKELGLIRASIRLIGLYFLIISISTLILFIAALKEELAHRIFFNNN